MPNFGAILRAILAGSLLLAADALGGGLHRHAEVRVTIGLMLHGEAETSNFSQEGLSRSGKDPIPIHIANTSDRTLDLYVDGNSWGDRTMTIYIYGKTRGPKVIQCSTSMYWHNVPEFVRLKPGDTWVRNISSDMSGWSELRDAIHSAPARVRIQARLEQPEKLDPYSPDPNLWRGTAQSEPLNVPVD